MGPGGDLLVSTVQPSFPTEQGGASVKVKTPQLSGSQSGAYVKVVLQGLWSGSAAGGEAEVVLQGVFVGQKLLC